MVTVNVNKGSKNWKVKTSDGKIVDECFPWGKPIHVHEIGDIIIVEHEWKNDYKIPEEDHWFHFYLVNKTGIQDSCTNATSLEKAIIAAIAMKYDGMSSMAGQYFCKMIGMK